MIKMVFIGATVFSIVLFAASSKVDHSPDPVWVRKGWPLIYKSSFNEGSIKAGEVSPALCLGADRLYRSPTCRVPGEFDNPSRLIYDLAFWMGLCLLIAYLVYYFKRTKTSRQST